MEDQKFKDILCCISSWKTRLGYMRQNKQSDENRGKHNRSSQYRTTQKSPKTQNASAVKMAKWEKVLPPSLMMSLTLGTHIVQSE